MTTKRIKRTKRRFKVLKQNCSKSGQIGKEVKPEDCYIGIKITLKFDDGKEFRFWYEEIQLVK